MAAPVVWQPPGPVALAFLKSRAFVCGIRGPFGSGKSITAIMKLMRIAQAQPKAPDGIRYSRFAIIRNTYPELKTTTIKSFHDWIPETVGKWQPEGPPTQWVEGDGLSIEIMFVALDRPDDVRKLLSMELTAAWVNEAREVPKAIIDGLTGRIGRYPRADKGGCPNPQLILDTNPPDTDHWWYVMAERDDSTPAGADMLRSLAEAEAILRLPGPNGEPPALADGVPLFEFFSQPDGLSDEAENAVGLSGQPGGRLGYYARASAGKTKEWIDVYVRGRYGFVADGKPIFPEYRDDLHCRPVPYNPKLPVLIGLDFGLTPAAVLLHQFPMGGYGAFDEVVALDMGAKKFGRLLSQKLAEYGIRDYRATGDPAGEQRSQADDEQTPFLMLAAENIVARPAETNDFTVRREAVAEPLGRLIDGVPGLIIDPRCKVLRKGMMGGYCYRRMAVSGDRFADKPDKGPMSHVCEAAGYALVGAGEGRKLLRRPESANRAARIPVIREDWAT